MLVGYDVNDKVYLAVDCIIFGFDEEDLKVLLIKRDFDPEKGNWSLMGGFMHQEETLDIAAARVLHNLSGIRDIYMEQLYSFSAIDRDPVERTISVAYYALINLKDHNDELKAQHSAKWFSLKDYPALIFDHSKMVEHAIKRLRYRASIKPIGFELLPEKFTMRQLRKLYEAIFDEDLDKRNFTNKVQALDILVKLEEKETLSSRKGSFLYTFDKAKYDKRIHEGFEFKL